MKISLSIVIVSLILAILGTVFAESRISRRFSNKMGSGFALCAFLCCYGVCIGVVSAIITYFFHIPEWLALLIALPLGIPLLILAAKVGES